MAKVLDCGHEVCKFEIQGLNLDLLDNCLTL